MFCELWITYLVLMIVRETVYPRAANSVVTKPKTLSAILPLEIIPDAARIPSTEARVLNQNSVVL